LPTATPYTGLCADLDGDGFVRVSDILIAVAVYGLPVPQADFDASGTVTVSDVLYVAHRYGAAC
jgi:hypothetical protein